MRHSEKKASLSQLCSLLGYSRQAFYSFEKHHTTAVWQEELILQQVLLHHSQQPRIGARKLLVLLNSFMQQHQIILGRDAFFALLRQQGLLVRKRKTRVQTTFSRHPYKKYKSLITDFEPLHANQLWVSDITYLPLADGFAYLSLVTGAYSKQIVGYCVSITLQADGSIQALKMALAGCNNPAGLIHHSDRGTQYCCHEYIRLLTEHTVQISMTENGDPLENAVAERVKWYSQTRITTGHLLLFSLSRTGGNKSHSGLKYASATQQL